MKYKHLNIEEREKIQELLWQNTSIRNIAKIIGRSPLKPYINTYIIKFTEMDMDI